MKSDVERSMIMTNRRVGGGEGTISIACCYSPHAAAASEYIYTNKINDPYSDAPGE